MELFQFEAGTATPIGKVVSWYKLVTVLLLELELELELELLLVEPPPLPSSPPQAVKPIKTHAIVSA